MALIIRLICCFTGVFFLQLETIQNLKFSIFQQNFPFENAVYRKRFLLARIPCQILRDTLNYFLIKLWIGRPLYMYPDTFTRAVNGLAKIKPAFCLF